MRPTREVVRTSEFAYFVSTQTEARKPFFRHERWAKLMIATLAHYEESAYVLHAFVVMPDHLHLLLSPRETIEKSAYQGWFLIQGQARVGLEGRDLATRIY